MSQEIPAAWPAGRRNNGNSPARIRFILTHSDPLPTARLRRNVMCLYQVLMDLSGLVKPSA
eukprot:1616492-Prymnesium_polylepis.1